MNVRLCDFPSRRVRIALSVITICLAWRQITYSYRLNRAIGRVGISFSRKKLSAICFLSPDQDLPIFSVRSLVPRNWSVVTGLNIFD